MTAPRLHVILAREAPFGVVIRRGPSKQVALVGWNTKDDSFFLGQWLKGRIYERRCDLSPDGQHLIYFAMNGKWDSETGGSWTAVSRAPYLAALHLYGWGYCWNGGGLFTSNESYWLNGSPGSGKQEFLDCGLSRQDDTPDFVNAVMGEDPVTYFPKLTRDGWSKTGVQDDGTNKRTTFVKAVRKHWVLEKSFLAGVGTGPLGQCYWETHQLRGPDQTIEGEDWEWAEVVKGGIVFAREGALWRMRVHAKTVETECLIKDFSDMAFESREAPYAHLQRSDPR